MNMRFVVRSFCHLVKKNASSILTGCAIGGLVEVAIESSKAAIATKQDVENYIRENDEVPTTLEVVKMAIPNYAETAVIGGLTAASMIGANSIGLNRTASALALASGLKKKNDILEKTMAESENADELREKYMENTAKEAFMNPPESDSEYKNYILDTGVGPTIPFKARPVTVSDAYIVLDHALAGEWVCSLSQYIAAVTKDDLSVEIESWMDNYGWNSAYLSNGCWDNDGYVHIVPEEVPGEDVTWLWFQENPVDDYTDFDNWV